MSEPYPGDLLGYGRNPPNPKWPNQARLAVQFVINYEEGGKAASYTAMSPLMRFCQKSLER